MWPEKKGHVEPDLFDEALTSPLTGRLNHTLFLAFRNVYLHLTVTTEFYFNKDQSVPLKRDNVDFPPGNPFASTHNSIASQPKKKCYRRFCSQPGLPGPKPLLISCCYLLFSTLLLECIGIFAHEYLVPNVWLGKIARMGEKNIGDQDAKIRLPDSFREAHAYLILARIAPLRPRCGGFYRGDGSMRNNIGKGRNLISSLFLSRKRTLNFKSMFLSHHIKHRWVGFHRCRTLGLILYAFMGLAVTFLLTSCGGSATRVVPLTDPALQAEISLRKSRGIEVSPHSPDPQRVLTPDVSLQSELGRIEADQSNQDSADPDLPNPSDGEFQPAYTPEEDSLNEGEEELANAVPVISDDGEQGPSEESEVFLEDAELGASLQVPIPPEDLRTSLLPNARVRIALLVPLSGSLEAVGQSLFRAALLALQDSKASDVVLLPFDTAGTPERARIAAHAAVESGAHAIVGPLLAENALAIRDFINQHPIPTVALTNDSTVPADFLVALGHTPTGQIKRIIEHATKENRRKFAVFAPNNYYGHVVAYQAEQALARAGGGLSRVHYYAPYEASFEDSARTLSDFEARTAALDFQIKSLTKDLDENRTTGGDFEEFLANENRSEDDEAALLVIDRLKKRDTTDDLGYDALLLVATDALKLQTMVAQLGFHNLSLPAVRIYGLKPWEDFGPIWQEPNIIGARFVAPDPGGWARFSKRYRATFNEFPPRLASIGYDGMALVQRAASTQQGPEKIRASFQQRNGWLGVEGLFRIDESGLAEHSYAIYEVARRSIKRLTRAPNQFPVEENEGLSFGEPELPLLPEVSIYYR